MTSVCFNWNTNALARTLFVCEVSGYFWECEKIGREKGFTNTHTHTPIEPKNWIPIKWEIWFYPNLSPIKFIAVAWIISLPFTLFDYFENNRFVSSRNVAEWVKICIKRKTWSFFPQISSAGFFDFLRIQNVVLYVLKLLILHF